MEKLVVELALTEQAIRNQSITIFPDMTYTGRWPWDRLAYMFNAIDFKNLSFLVVDFFIPFMFTFILLAQFAVYYKHYSTNKMYKILADHAGYYFWISVVLFAIINGLALNHYGSVDLNTNTYFLSGYYLVNLTTQTIKFLTYVIWGFLLIHISAAKVYDIKQRCIDIELPILYFLLLALCLTVTSANNLGLFVLVLEAISLLLYIITLASRSFGSINGSIQYFIFGSLASVSIFWGIINIFSKYYSLNIAAWFIVSNKYIDILVRYDASWYFGFIILGLLIKLGAAPFYAWVIDVYSGISYYWLAVFGIYIKFVMASLVFKFLGFNFIPLATDIIAILSLIIGCVGTLRQTEIKKFFAYGSITHVGFLLMSDFNSFWIYLLTYLLSSLAAFFVLLRSEVNGQELIYLSDLRLLLANSGMNRFIFTLALLSLAGIPPFAGFFGKFAVLASLVEDIFLFNDMMSYILLAVALTLTLVVAFYYFRVIVWLYTDISGAEAVNMKSLNLITPMIISRTEAIFSIVTLTFFGFATSPLLQIIMSLDYV